MKAASMGRRSPDRRRAACRDASVLLYCVFFVGLAIGLGWGGGDAEARAPRAAMVLDANSGKVLYAQSPDALRHPASLTKIMTLYIVFDMIRQGRLSPNARLVVTENAAAQPPSKLGLKPGSTIALQDAIRALVTKSANDVAVVIAENLAGTEEKFARIMTWTARQIGMTRTTFRNASGLPDPRQVTTARDMITLARRMIEDFPKEYRVFRTRYFRYHGRRYRNHNTLLFNFAGTDGIKTGYTRASGFNLVASVRRGRKHVLGVVMGGASARARNVRMRRLLRLALKRASTKRPPRRPRARPRPLLMARARPAVLLRLPVPKLVAAREGEVLPWRRPAAVRAPRPAPARLERAVLRAPAPRPARPPVPSVSAAVAPPPAPRPAPALRGSTGPFHVQIGAFLSERDARLRLNEVRGKAAGLLADHPPVTTMFQPRADRVYYRARFAGFDKTKARSTCARLKRQRIACIVMRAN